MVDGDEFEPEGFSVVPVAGLDMNQLRRDPVFLELGCDERQSELGANEGNIGTFSQQVGNPADVIFVAVSEYDADNVSQAVSDGGEVGKDDINAWLVLFREEDTTIDDEQFSAVFEDCHIAPDFTESSQWCDPKASRFECGRSGECTRRRSQRMGLSLLSGTALWLVRLVVVDAMETGSNRDRIPV